MTREEKITSIAKGLSEGGWSSIYSYVEDHADDRELDEEEYSDEDEDGDDDDVNGFWKSGVYVAKPTIITL